MRTVFIMALSVVLVATLEVVYYGVRFAVRRRSEEIRRRLKAIGLGEADNSLLRRGRFAANAALDSWLRSLALARRTERLLESADSGLTVARLWSISCAIAAGTCVCSIALGFAPLPTLFLAAAASALPTLLLVVAADRRSQKISEQLPEALDMMSRSLQAGHATSIAFQMVATELPEPVSVEFGRAFEEQRLGLPLEQAILHMTERAPNNRDLKIFATSVIIQKETGGNLSELLAGLAETIRARYRFQGKVRSLTAEGRASGLVLALIPIAFVAALQVMNPKYFEPLVTTPLGHTILFYTAAAWLAGVAWLRSLTKVDL
jgi:tight adherence protein B